ncbi:hypothetical protein ACIBCR_15005 [Micromonospora echinospora]|uniref:hypothetical protein n=1 Tax=Micromonospora echinospora TaxID=1877 RepID=UPI0037B50508
MRKLLSTILAGAALTLALTGIATPAHAETPDVTVGSPCYEPIYGRDWTYWTVANNTSADIVASITADTTPPNPSSFTIPAGGSVVRETLSPGSVEVTVAGVVVASASVPFDSIPACRTTNTDFNLIIDCRPSPYQVTLRIKNATDEARQYKLTKQRGEELTGTALPGNTFITEDWVKPTDRWSLEIAGYKYVRVVNEPASCNATPTPTATNHPSPNPTGSLTPKPTGPSDPDPTGPAPTTTPTPNDPEPTMAPVSSVTGLGSGNGALTVGFAGLVVGLALGFSAAMQMRRRNRRAG